MTALRSPEMKQRLATDGAEPLGSTPAEFAAFIRRELDKWGRVAEAARSERQQSGAPHHRRRELRGAPRAHLLPERVEPDAHAPERAPEARLTQGAAPPD